MSQSPRRLLGFDFGLKRIGVAIAQEVTQSTSALSALNATMGKPDWQAVQQLLDEWQPDALVVGLPLNMDGSEQPITQAAKKFANRLHGRFGLPVFQVDERLTTVDARQQLFDQGGYRRLSSAAVDSHAAELILHDFMNSEISG